MANLKEVRTRIASVSSTQQITSAMKMVSAAKFRRAQNAIVGMRPYANQLGQIAADIDTGDGIQTPYHEVRKLENVLLVVVTSNKGLCGAFNSNVIKQAQARIDHYRSAATSEQPARLAMITIGKRCSDFFGKRFDNVVGSYDELLDGVSFDAVATLSDNIMQQFCDKKYDRVELVYNQFKNSLVQILSTEQFLPIQPDAAPKWSTHECHAESHRQRHRTPQGIAPQLQQGPSGSNHQRDYRDCQRLRSTERLNHAYSVHLFLAHEDNNPHAPFICITNQNTHLWKRNKTTPFPLL